MPRRRVDITVYGTSPASAMPLITGAAAYGSTQGGWRFMLRAVDDPRLIQTLAGSSADGFIIATSPEQIAAAIKGLHVPVVNVVTPAPTGVPSLLLDDVAIGRLAARHLLDRGLKHFAYVGLNETDSLERERGFVEELRHEGRACEIGHPPGASNERWDWNALLSTDCLPVWLKTLPCPAGALAFNDQLAMRLLEACETIGRRVPEDLAILGTDNDQLICPFAPVPLSSVEPDVYRLGYEAARLLDQLIDGAPRPEQPILVPPRAVISRRSTDMLAIDDALVRSALHFIHEHACDSLRVDDVLDQLGVSRASLDRRFLAVMGRSPGEEIRRVRLAEARRLLEETRLSHLDVAMQCGFASLQHMCRAFKLAFGMSPGAYRKSLHGK